MFGQDTFNPEQVLVALHLVHFEPNSGIRLSTGLSVTLGGVT